VEPRVFPWTESRVSEHETIRTYKTGAVWRYVTSPVFFRDMVRAPFPGYSGNLDDLFWNEEDEDDTREMGRTIDALHAHDYYVEIVLYGAWLGIYLAFMQFEDALRCLASDTGLIRELVARIEAVNLKAIERYSALGADGFVWADDSGSDQSLLFSPRTYEELFFPAHKSWTARCHELGVIARMHSHGHIERIMDYIVDANIDVVHPVGPGDNNDLGLFKRRWGTRICINGGISKFIAEMPYDRMKTHIDSVLQTGLPGGGFIPCTEGGIPSMPAEKVDFFVKYLADALAKHRRKSEPAQAPLLAAPSRIEARWYGWVLKRNTPSHCDSYESIVSRDSRSDSGSWMLAALPIMARTCMPLRGPSLPRRDVEHVRSVVRFAGPGAHHEDIDESFRCPGFRIYPRNARLKNSSGNRFFRMMR